MSLCSQLTTMERLSQIRELERICNVRCTQLTSKKKAFLDSHWQRGRTEDAEDVCVGQLMLRIQHKPRTTLRRGLEYSHSFALLDILSLS